MIKLPSEPHKYFSLHKIQEEKTIFVNTGGAIAAIIANQNAQRMRREREQHERAERERREKRLAEERNKTEKERKPFDELNIIQK